MKIWYEFPRPSIGAEGFYERLKANWKRIGKSDSELVIKAPTKGTSEFRYSIVGHMYADTLRTIEMIEGIVQAEKEGYDAAVLGCFGDPGLDVLGALVDIPVTGPAKAGIWMAQAVGTKMAFITLPHWEKKVERIINIYSIRDLVLPHKPCRPLSIPLDDFKDENRVLGNFVEIAKGAIHDGADVVVLACVNCSTFLTHRGIGDIDGIPLVDGAMAALKMAEVMVDFKRAGFWKSKKTIPTEIKEALRKGYYCGVESI